MPAKTSTHPGLECPHPVGEKKVREDKGTPLPGRWSTSHCVHTRDLLPCGIGYHTFPRSPPAVWAPGCQDIRIPAIAASHPSLTPHSVSAPGSTARGGWPILLFYSAPDALPTKACPDLPFAWSPLCFHPLPLPHALCPPTSLTPLTPTWQKSLKWMDLLHKSLSLRHRIILYVSRLDLAPYVTGRSGAHPKARISVPS